MPVSVLFTAMEQSVVVLYFSDEPTETHLSHLSYKEL